MRWKKIANWIYVRVFHDRAKVALLSEYLRISKGEILWLLKNGGRLNNDFWLMENPKTSEEKEQFYRITPFYIFELSWWHMTPYQKRLRRQIISCAKGKVLDFGGGIGDISLAAHAKGLQVEYADVAGRTYSFAKWVFAKKGAHVLMTDVSRGEVAGAYDTIVCVDVLEHLPNAKEIFENLVRRLNQGGYMIATNLTVSSESSKYHPMHEDAGISDGHYLASLGLEKGEKPWLLIKK